MAPLLLPLRLLLVLPFLLQGVAPARGLCPPRCECDDSTLLASCEAASLEVLPIQLNPDVEVMRLAGNRISHLDYSMGFYPRLRALDVSSNRLQMLGPGLFQSQHRLVELNVSSNDLTSLASEAFVGLSSLRVLDLSGNRLQVHGEVSGVWRGLDSLWELDLSRNALDALSPEVEDECSPLRNLRTLQLNANQLVEPPATCLSQLASLRHLGLADNLMAMLHEGAFPPALRDLVSLHLQGNQLARLAPGALDNLSSLQLLDLSDNNLTHVPSAALAKLSGTLMELDLSGNPITHIGPVAFQSLFELRRLRVSRLTELVRVDQRALVDNIRLEDIELELCPRLKRLPPRLFHGNPLVARVSLRGNALQTIGATDLPLAQLRHLALADNPLRCNCSILWLWRLARDAPPAAAPSNQTPSWTPSAAGAVCWEPLELRGTPVPQAPEAHVGCDASWTTVLMVTGVVVSLFVLTCAILFYCGGGGRWCTRAEPSDTPISVARTNGIKEQYPTSLSAGNVYHHHHHVMHHHPHLGHVNMWPPPEPAELGAADLAASRDFEYTDGGVLVCKKPPPPSSTLGVYV